MSSENNGEKDDKIERGGKRVRDSKHEGEDVGNCGSSARGLDNEGWDVEGKELKYEREERGNCESRV